MRKNVLAMSIATLIGGLGLAGGASAGVWNTATADTLAINPGGIGQILLVPYYSASNNTMSLLNIVNTDTTNGKAVKVRFRGAGNSDDVFDFQLFLSPGDVYSAAIVAREGLAHLETADNTCVLPYTVRGKGVDPQTSTPFVTSRLGATGTDNRKGSLEGYVEILNMADVPPSSALYTATKHKADGTVDCTAATLDNLKYDPLDATTPPAIATTVRNYFNAPTTGLMANWTIINVTNVASWGGAATAVEARIGDENGPAGAGNIVFSPQTPTVATALDLTYTADPLLKGNLIASAKYDFPDLSTPYVTDPAGSLAAEAQAAVLTQALAVSSVTNEYITSASVVGGTDWVFSMPTRRYHVAYNYNGATAAARVVWNSTLKGQWFQDGAGGNITVDESAVRIANAGVPVICTVTPAGNLSWYNRSELTPTTPTDDFVVSPGTPTQAKAVPFCGEVSVLGINAAQNTFSDVLGATVGMNQLTLRKDGQYNEGWASIKTPAYTAGYGLPILGAAFTRMQNITATGLAGNFGSVFPHRYQKTPSPF